MIRAAAGWMRLTLPPTGILVGCLLLYGFIEAIFFYFWVVWGLGVTEGGQQILDVRDGAAAACGVAYGAYRVMAFHPVFRPVYRGWLQFTPWTSEKPLPAGPIHLVLQDVVLIAVVILMLHHSRHAVWIVPSAMLAGYLAALSVAFLVTGLEGTCYALAFGLGLAIRLAPDPYAALGVLVLLYPLAYRGLRSSLARFPWPEFLAWGTFWSSFNKPIATRRPQGLGWPFDRLQPKPLDAGPSFVRSPVRALLLSLLIGWHLHAAMCHVSDSPGDEPFVVMFYFYLCVAAIAVRLYVYLWYHRPPISILGRILALRWIIPGFDQVLGVPMLAVIAMVGVPWLIAMTGLPISIVMGMSLSLVLFICLAGPPSLQHWHLTGSHRIVPGPSNQRELERL